MMYKSPFVSLSTYTTRLSHALESDNTSPKDRLAISGLGTSFVGIRKALDKAHSSEGFDGQAFQKDNADELAARISKIAGKKYVIEKVPNPRPMNKFSKKFINVLKAK